MHPTGSLPTVGISVEGMGFAVATSHSVRMAWPVSTQLRSIVGVASMPVPNFSVLSNFPVAMRTLSAVLSPGEREPTLW
jgi:hypothetical protein